MSDLVRVRVNNQEVNVGAGHAARVGLDVLAEPTSHPSGTLRKPSRASGRKPKPKTTVAKAAAAKKADSNKPAETAEEANE